MQTAGDGGLPGVDDRGFTSVVTDRDEADALAVIVNRLRERFPQVPAETVDTVVADYHREYDGLPIRMFVPLLVEREARDHLRRGIPRQRQGGDSPDDTGPVAGA